MGNFEYRSGETYVRPENTRPTCIRAAAILTKDNKIWTGKRHSDIISKIHMETHEYVSYSDTQQGFLSDDGRFLNRTQAMAVAHQAKQLIKEKTLHPRELFSEDLW